MENRFAFRALVDRSELPTDGREQDDILDLHKIHPCQLQSVHDE
jgi:hypothetical protein